MRKGGRRISPLLPLLFVAALFLLSNEIIFAEDADSLFSVGISAYREGHYTTSIASFEKLKKYYPEYGELDYALYLMSVSYFQIKEYKRCIEKGEELRENYPESRFRNRIYYWMGIAYYKLNQYEKAIYEFGKLIEFYSKYNKKHDSFYIYSSYYSGLSLGKLKKYQQAISLFEKLKSDRNAHSILGDIIFELAGFYYREGSYAKAGSLYREFIINFPDNSSFDKALFFSAECSFMLGENSDAEKRYKRYLELFHNLDYRRIALYRLAYIAYRRGSISDAYSYITKLEDLIRSSFANKGKISTGFNLNEGKLKADVLYDMGDYSGASRLYEEIAKEAESENTSNGFLSVLDFNAGISFKKAGNLEKALEYLRKAKKIGNSEIRERSMLEIAILLQNLGSFEEAEKGLQDLIRVSTERDIKESALMKLAEIYEENNQWKRAFDAWGNLIDEYFDSGKSDLYLFRRGLVGIQLSRDTEALRDFERIRRDYPSSAFLLQSLYEIGYIYSLKGEYSRAMGYFQRVMDKVGTLRAGQATDRGSRELVGKTSFALGAVYFNMGSEKKAMEFFKLAVESGNEDVVGESYFYMGMIALKTEKYKEAVTYLKSASLHYADKGKIAQALFWKGWALFRMEDYESSKEIFLDIARNYPFIAAASYYRAGVCSRQLKSYNEALGYFDQAIDSLSVYTAEDTKDLEGKILYEKVVIYIDLSIWDKAKKTVDLLSKKYPDLDLTGKAYFKIGKALYDSGKYGEASKILNKLIKNFPKSNQRELGLYWKGKSLLEMNKYADALNSFLSYLEAYPQGAFRDASVRGIRELLATSKSEKLLYETFNYAKKSRTIEDKLKALIYLEYAEHISEVEPEKSYSILKKILSWKNVDDNARAETQYQVGLYHEKNGNLKRALEVLSGIADARSDIWGAKAQLETGRIYEKLGEWEKAVEKYLTLSYIFSDFKDYVLAGLKSAEKIYRNQGRKNDADAISERIYKLQDR